MPKLDISRLRQPLQEFNFKRLFNELGWESFSRMLHVVVDGQSYSLQGVAEKRGLAVFTCLAPNGGAIPDYPTRRKIDHKVAKDYREHIIVFTDGARQTQVWQWVRRELGQPLASREHRYSINQSGEALIQKLNRLFFSLDEEESLTIVDVVGRTRAALDVERVTRRFYDRFKTEHAQFLKFLQGIPDEGMQRWYVSVMLNRLMFIYFIQKKGFLNGDPDYLRHALERSQRQGPDRFYREFLGPLFFYGFAQHESERSAATNRLLGKVPYLNGGLFQRHQIEELHGEQIQIADRAFEQLFDFFDAYQWHLDERPLRDDREINPDVLGYIFEKYINQKQMGAYYTKEDITEYISKNTVIPFLLDQARRDCRIAFEGERSVWRLLQEDPDRYIYEAVRKGADLPLPEAIQAGVNDVAQRGSWNRPAPDDYALPTEIWREVVARRQRYEEVRAKLSRGEVRDVNDLITLNLDVRQFAQDVVASSEGPELLRALYKAVERVSVLDPTCGSGAFLFAALNILEPLYEACLERMAVFVAELDASGQKHHPEKYGDFRKVLRRVAEHPNQRYFILKSIIVNNLYGVDIMEEAVEICKLRLFLKLVAQIERVEDIEPLPDIDFNIRAGNTLVGFATYDEVKRAVTTAAYGQARLMLPDQQDALRRIEDKATMVAGATRDFRRQQTELGGQVTPADKAELRRRLSDLENELNRYLAGEYGIDAAKLEAYKRWLDSHKPFHWFIEFYDIMKEGGFDVIIGNPPYVEYRLVRSTYELQSDKYNSLSTNNLYAFCMERSTSLLGSRSLFGMIVPAGVMGLDDAVSLRQVLLQTFSVTICSTYAIRPSKLFDGVDQRLCIYIGSTYTSSSKYIWTSRYHHWSSDERENLFKLLVYNKTDYLSRLNRIPQVGSREASSILRRIERQNNQCIDTFYAKYTVGYLIHYHRSPRYWIRAMDFEQYFRSPTRTRSVHHLRDLRIREALDAKTIGAILNSSLFFFWFVSLGNGRNITGVDVESFPVGILNTSTLNEITPIFDKLMEDYRRHSFVRTRQDCEYQEFRPSRSKPIIDEIDRVLAKHYGFTDEELDFIINYDIKYRMGRDNGEGEDE